MHRSAFSATGPQSTAGRRVGGQWQEIVSDVCLRRRRCCPAGPWPPRHSRAPLFPLPPCRPAGSRCGVSFSSRWPALMAVQALHHARRVRPATLFQRRASSSPGGGATTAFAVPSALRLRCHGRPAIAPWRGGGPGRPLGRGRRRARSHLEPQVRARPPSDKVSATAQFVRGQGRRPACRREHRERSVTVRAGRHPQGVRRPRGSSVVL